MGNENNVVLYMINLHKDASTNKIAAFSEKAANHIDDALRRGYEEILGGELNYTSFRNHKNEIFTIWEETLRPALPESWKTNHPVTSYS